MALFPLQDDGTIEPISYLDVHQGHGTHPFFQQSPHPHAVIFSIDNQFAVVCDKGNDTITVYKMDALHKKLIAKTSYKTKVGTGPRHAVFHPSMPYLFVINELVSSLSSFHFNPETGELFKIDTQPTIPADYTTANYPADIRIHPNGMYLFASNRGHDSIVTFKIDQKTGKLTWVANTSTKGETPREFNLTPSGQYLLVGNQDSNNIVAFSIEASSGMLTQSSITNNIQKPVCIQVLARAGETESVPAHYRPPPGWLS